MINEGYYLNSWRFIFLENIPVNIILQGNNPHSWYTIHSTNEEVSWRPPLVWCHSPLYAMVNSNGVYGMYWLMVTIFFFKLQHTNFKRCAVVSA